MEPINFNTVGTEQSNMAEAQGKDLKTTVKKILEILKEEMNESVKEMQRTPTVGGNR